ncbi:NTP transferase domain-containing protein [Propylenella binzhouense]|uniref:4-diphosphocytidyl-2C-methyl-D-erythritol kinase n=1 Tax=Propylenella binzhouense TaxID=2555902 RepID=A0A964T3Y2_9HYPH|nr:molybdopterin-binding/glycosyltransferase family 2 protein [Propylenella binzhouense]MYZ47492.1 4-diphosphocytidyl-2C-methyl-D-erythritol kinase [Propylenella binzhouense]
MRFGPVPVAEAEGSIAAHSVRLAGRTIKKGTRLGPEQIAALTEAGIAEVVVAVLDPADIGEDDAAERVGSRLLCPSLRADPPFTGRCNIFAKEAGLFIADRESVDALNRLDPGLTLATLPSHTPVEAGRMVATVKVIPFAVREEAVAKAEALLAGGGALEVAAWRPARVGMAATVLPGLKPTVMDKTRRVFEERLKPTGSTILSERRVPHEVEPLAEAIAGQLRDGSELIVVFGASAITDAGDVIPEAVRRAGGRIIHFGMPVDPGNLLLVGELGGVPVLGAPGCARSPAENGFDWILQRLLAGIPVEPEDITGLGVGGLLMEIVSRPQPRNPAREQTGKSVAAVVLAAGQSRRMGGPNKLLATFDGEPLVRRTVRAALASAADPVIVVTGHMRDEVAKALSDLPATVVENPDFADGLATSLKAGVAAVPQEASGAIVLLADMPMITTANIDALIAAFDPERPGIVLPTVSGKRGNPVLWSRHFFPELLGASGDVGARHLIARYPDAVTTVELGAAAGLDVDTPDALVAAGGILPE